ncbi:MAG: hypothetical protein PWQ51_2059 [Methanolobus sp.]|nr:hypothetical protein [Methanolobus sp.]
MYIKLSLNVSNVKNEKRLAQNAPLSLCLELDVHVSNHLLAVNINQLEVD